MNKQELLMGRADVLLRFLQRIDKDRPRDLDPFLEGLDRVSDNRPLVDQIVDRIISENAHLYEEYAIAKKEVGLRNPYSSTDEKNQAQEDEALGKFIFQWSNLERLVRTLMERRNADRASTQNRFILQNQWKFIYPDAPKSIINEIDHIRRLRNQVVHGMKLPPPEILNEASSTIKDVNDYLIRTYDLPA